MNHRSSMYSSAYLFVYNISKPAVSTFFLFYPHFTALVTVAFRHLPVAKVLSPCSPAVFLVLMRMLVAIRLIYHTKADAVMSNVKPVTSSLAEECQCFA